VAAVALVVAICCCYFARQDQRDRDGAAALLGPAELTDEGRLPSTPAAAVLGAPTMADAATAVVVQRGPAQRRGPPGAAPPAALLQLALIALLPLPVDADMEGVGYMYLSAFLLLVTIAVAIIVAICCCCFARQDRRDRDGAAALLGPAGASDDRGLPATLPAAVAGAAPTVVDAATVAVVQHWPA